jgi:hypothetical protein
MQGLILPAVKLKLLCFHEPALFASESLYYTVNAQSGIQNENRGYECTF